MKKKHWSSTRRSSPQDQQMWPCWQLPQTTSSLSTGYDGHLLRESYIFYWGTAGHLFKIDITFCTYKLFCEQKVG